MVGRYAEASPHLSELLHYLAERQARTYAAFAGIDKEKALSPFLSSLRLSLVLRVARSWARIRIKAASDIICPPSLSTSRSYSPKSSADIFEIERFDSY